MVVAHTRRVETKRLQKKVALSAWLQLLFLSFGALLAMTSSVIPAWCRRGSIERKNWIPAGACPVPRHGAGMTYLSNSPPFFSLFLCFGRYGGETNSKYLF